MSKLRCWPGCIARIQNDTYPENIGKYVTVIRRSKWEGTPGMEPGPQWECEPQSPVKATYLDTSGRVLSVRTELSRVDMPDAWLRPITPPPGSVTEDEVKELYQPKTTEPA